MGIDQADQRLVRHRLVADPQREVGDRAVGRRQQLGLVELPLQIGDFRGDRLDRRLVQGLCLACLDDGVLGIGESGCRFLLLRRGILERLARHKAGGGDGSRAPQIVCRHLLLGGSSVARRLGRFDQIMIDRELRLGLDPLGNLLSERQPERRRVDLGEQGSLGHGLVIDDRHRDDAAGDPRGNTDEIGSHIGVIGIGKDVARSPIKAERQQQSRQDQQHPPAIAPRRRDVRIDGDGTRAQQRRRRQPRVNRGSPIAKGRIWLVAVRHRAS